MEAKVHFYIHSLVPSSGIQAALTVGGPTTVNFRTPQQLSEANFPVGESNFNAEVVGENPDARNVISDGLGTAAGSFIRDRQNLVVFAYGLRSTPRRQLMYGGSGMNDGYATKVISDVVQSGAGQGIFTLSCYVVGPTEHLTDLINYENELGVIVDSVKEGPRVRMVERRRLNSPDDVKDAMRSVVKNYEAYFASVLPMQQPTPELQALPPYLPDTIMMQLHRYDSEEAFNDHSDANSLSFIALGDSDRPVLCGVDGAQLSFYEKAQRTIASAAGIVSSIRCNRLRIPFGKSKMSQLLRRAYNSEKGNVNNNNNQPTKTFFFIHAFSDGSKAEESFHCLALTRRVSNLLGSTAIGSITRDLAVDKWRLDQDIVELRDELLIARSVYDYRPCIFEQAKPIANVREEEQKRVNAIQTKRDEAQEKLLNHIRVRAEEEAKQAIAEQERSSGTTLAQLEKALEQKNKENASLQAEREKKIKDYEVTLEKIRKKKEDEEEAAEKLRGEMEQLEQELTVRQTAIEKKQKQLEMAQMDKAKGREAIMKERVAIQASRQTVLDERRRQRTQWINQIRDMNEKVLKQVQALVEERKRGGQQASAKEEEAEKALVEDIQSIEKYLPKLISLEDVPADVDVTESIRRQFDEYFAQEKQVYLSKIDEERARKDKLEKGLEVYRSRVVEIQTAKRQENMQEALKKEEHLHSLVDQVITYLQRGLRMFKISSKNHVRRRFFFLSEDCKRIHSCELDHAGVPVGRKKPPVTIWIKDIKKVILGTYTSSFTNFSSDAQLTKARGDAVSDSGTYRHDPTVNITAVNLGLYNYRSFALMLRGGKTLEVVCEMDSDCEAWLVSLKRLLNYKTPVERMLEQRLHTRDGGAAAPVAESTADMKWGGSLDVRNMRGFVSLSPEEAVMCSENHVPPALYLRVKQAVTEQGQASSVTLYDVRVTSTLDLIRSGLLYDFLVEKRIVPLPF